MFKKQLEDIGLSPEKYLKIAQKRARDLGLNLPQFSTNSINKLQVIDDNNKIVRFGRVGYNDNIIYSYLEKKGDYPKGYSDKMRNRYWKSHTQIKSEKWKDNIYSPNYQSLVILW
jgi:hypothetical protein